MEHVIIICYSVISHLHRHLQSFWGASGDFWQAQWDKFIDITGKLANWLLDLYLELDEIFHAAEIFCRR